MSSPDPRHAPTIDRDDVDDAIGIAAEQVRREEGKVSVEELADIGGELGIPEHAVRGAVTELHARRAAEEERASRRRAAIRRTAQVAAVVGGLLLVVVSVAAFSGEGALATERTEAERRRAQVANVVARKAEVEARLARTADLDPGERNAELAGSENRVAVEKRRYDEAAARYNGRAARFPNGLWADLFGHPRALPLSNEIDRW